MGRWLWLLVLLAGPALLADPAGAQPSPRVPSSPVPSSPVPSSSAPPPPATPADRAAHAAAERKAALDKALAALQAAGTEQEAAPLEARVRQMWLNAGTPAVTLLIGRGQRELKGGAAEDAERDFQAALTLDPDSVEAWHHIALARFSAGDMAGAVAAIGETLKREPRHFAALQSLARFAEAREDWRGAYEAWSKALGIAPKLEGGAEKLKDLKRRALGDDT